MVASLHGACRKWREMQACAAELMALATTHDLPFWWAVGACNHGIALAQQGNATEGINQIRQGLAVYRAAGTTIGIPRILGWLAEGCVCAGQLDEGLQVLAEAFAVIKQGDERIWEAELYRRKGEATLQKLSVASSQLSVPNPQSLPLNTQHVTLKRRRKPKRVFTKLLRLRGSSRRSHWNCEQRRVWRACGIIKTRQKKHTK